MNDGLKSVRSRHDDAVSRLDGERLRALLAEYYRRQGYRVDAFDTVPSADAEDGSAGGEIGLRLQREDSRLLVRCLHWNDRQVPHQRLRAWLDILDAEPADGSIFVTSGEFTPSAVRTASLSKTLRLVDGVELRKMLMPLLDEGEPSTGEDAAFADVSAFADDFAAAPAPPRAASVPDVGGDSERDELAPASPHRSETAADDPQTREIAAPPAAKTKTEAPAKASRKTVSRTGDDESLQVRAKRVMWERGSRPASNMSIAVAIILLSLIVATIVFRDQLDPYLGDSKPPAAAAPRNESPLTGTDYKSAKFDPAIRAQDEPVVQAPKPKRPENNPHSQSSQASPDEAIKVIERNTPEMWSEEQKRKAASKDQR